jgi:hypothetical protein
VTLLRTGSGGARHAASATSQQCRCWRCSL